MKIDPEKRPISKANAGSFPSTPPSHSGDPMRMPELRENAQGEYPANLNHSEREILRSLSRRFSGEETTEIASPEAPICQGFFLPTAPDPEVELQMYPAEFQWTTPLVRETQKVSEKKKVKRDSFLEISVVVLLALFLALLLKTYVAEAYMIRGHSMNPTFEDQQRVMVLKSFYDVERGDIVIFNSKTDPHKDLIKRVIGLPGDTVEVRDGNVIRNGSPLPEDYITEYKYNWGENHPPIKVPQNEIYVLGDNRPQSQDSRKFSTVPLVKLKGKVVLRWWPASTIQTF